MAGNKLNTSGKIRASSILEVIISMVVIVIVFSIAMGIFANVQRLSLSAQKVHAQVVLKDELLKAEHAPQLSKQTKMVDDFEVNSEITLYNSNTDLYQITLIAFDHNQQKLAELKEVVYAQ